MANKANSEELVKIRLPKTKEKQDAVTVGLNGTMYQIQRGIEVEVPKPVYEILVHSQTMDELALERQESLQSKAKL